MGSVTAERREEVQRLYEASVRVITENQMSSGAYIASPTFENYRFCWLRDGSFIGYAALLAGKLESARAFLDWTNGVILRHRSRIESIAEADGNGILPARYTIDGAIADDGWPDLQIDGYGAWLWLLAEYINGTGEDFLLHRYSESIRLTITYLRDRWERPTYDCWEENGDAVHTSTLACVYGGLSAINLRLAERDMHELCQAIKERALSLTQDGRFKKSSINDDVDSSLLWLSTPFRLVEPNDPMMRQTVRVIEERLLDGGGLKRYPGDVYYGGGQWLLLSAWLGWYYTEVGRDARARELFAWVASKADEEDLMPEQVTESVADKAQVTEWTRRWGSVAKPLLWSHAMYIILSSALERKSSRAARD